MKRRRVVVLSSLAIALACLIGAACTFPDVAFAPPGGGADGGEGGGNGGEGGTDGSRDGTTSDSTVADGETDAGIADAPPLDGTSTKPDTGTCIDPCDCDKDGFKARDAGCGGNDCDDTDNRANPSANFRTDLATKDTNGDWNCDRVTERLIKNVNVKCNGLGDTCPGGREGLQADIPCGTYGTYVVCAPGAVGVTCDQVDSGTVRQECR